MTSGKYEVQHEHLGCPNCGEGSTWVVIGSGGFVSSIKYGLKDDAQNHADALNRLFTAIRKTL